MSKSWFSVYWLDGSLCFSPQHRGCTFEEEASEIVAPASLLPSGRNKDGPLVWNTRADMDRLDAGDSSERTRPSDRATKHARERPREVRDVVERETRVSAGVELVRITRHVFDLRRFRDNRVCVFSLREREEALGVSSLTLLPQRPLHIQHHIHRLHHL